LKLLPPFLARRLSHRPNLEKIADNIAWLLIDKAVRMGVGLVVGVWVARYLGPEQFGLFNYALAFAGLFGSVAVLGLNEIVVRDLVKTPDQAPVTLGTSFWLHVLGSMLATGLMVGAILWLRPDDALTHRMVLLLGLTTLFQSTAVIKYWFEAKVTARYTVWVENGAFLCFALVRVALILAHAPLIGFLWAVLFENALVAIGLVWIYRQKRGTLPRWQVSLNRARSLLWDAWPVMLSGLAVMLYMRIDQIMLGEMLGQRAVGIYSAALRVSEVWYTVPVILVASFFPTIIESKKTSTALYAERLGRLLDLMVVIALGIALGMSLLSPWIIGVLYGSRYAEASGVLVIHIWTCLFVFIGVVGRRWYVFENLQLLDLGRVVLGALANVGLNLVLIRPYGVVGAAMATLVSQAIAAYLADALSKRTRGLFWAKTQALCLGPIRLWRRAVSL
jgi:PST family polysaccharide transporter